MASQEEDWMYDSDEAREQKKNKQRAAYQWKTTYVFPKRQVNINALPCLNRHSLSLPQELKSSIIELLGKHHDLVNLFHLSLVSKEWYRTVEGVWQELAAKEGCSRLSRGKTWCQLFMQQLAHRCFECGVKFSARGVYPVETGLNPLDPKGVKVCGDCSTLIRYDKCSEHDLRTYDLTMDDVADLPYERSARANNSYTSISFLTGDVLRISRAKKQTRNNQKSELAKLHNGPDQDLLDAITASEATHFMHPQSQLPAMKAAIFEKFAKTGTVEEATLKSFVEYHQRLMGLIDTVWDKLATELGEDDADGLAPDAYTQMATNCKHHPPRPFYDLIASGLLSVDLFLDLVKSNYAVEDAIKEARASS